MYCSLVSSTNGLKILHGEVGFYLAQALSCHGCFNAYLRQVKRRNEEMCCYCDFPVDNAEHALFVCAKWGVAKEALGQAVGAELTPDTMVSLMLQSKRIWTLVKSFVTLVIKARARWVSRAKQRGGPVEIVSGDSSGEEFLYDSPSWCG